MSSNENALLGQKNENPNANPKKSKDEEDLQERSTKKMKGGKEDGRIVSVHLQETTKGLQSLAGEKVGERSYCDMVTERIGSIGSDGEEAADDTEEDKGADMKVEEKMDGDYACPEFVFSKLEEKRIYRG
jgi:hypothetical protein